MKQVSALLTIAGTDPSGGAGIPVDLQVFRDFGYHGLSAVTAVVWQNTVDVRGFEPLAGIHVVDQIDAVFDDIPVAGVKIGMLATAEVVKAVAGFLRSADLGIPVVYDPVLASGKGTKRLKRSGMVAAIRENLLERVDWLTPNIPEAQELLSRDIHDEAAMKQAAVDLLDDGPRRVLLKAGHLAQGGEEGSIADVLAERRDDGSVHARRLAAMPRVAGDVRGTGCQLSSALAAVLADGERGARAADRARRYLNELLRENAVEIGKGRPVVCRTGSRDG